MPARAAVPLLLAALALAAPHRAAGQAACQPSTARVLRAEIGSGAPVRTSPDPVPVELRDTISLVVQGLDTLVRERDCRQDGGAIVLFLDGRPVPGATAYPPSDEREGVLHFELRRADMPGAEEASERVWTHVLGRPGFAPRVLPVSVGLSTRYAVPSDAAIALTIIPPAWFLFWLALFLLSLALFGWLIARSDIVRSASPAPLAGQRPYSLSRLQAAWWFFLTLAAYLFIGIVTGQWSTSINGTVLTLLGIAGGTTLGSAVIDAGKETRETELASQAVAAELRGRIARLDGARTLAERDVRAVADGPQAADAAGRLADLQRQIIALRSAEAKAARRSEGLLIDVVSDANGVSFHRFQLLVLTVVLGIVFVHGVWLNLTMPEFDGSLLGLLGLSSLSYLGLKVPEPSIPRQVRPLGADAPAPDQAGHG